MKDEILVYPHQEHGVMFVRITPYGERRIYYRGFWRATLHIMKLIFNGHDVRVEK